jgi:hypothetical protein
MQWIFDLLTRLSCTIRAAFTCSSTSRVHHDGDNEHEDEDFVPMSQDAYPNGSQFVTYRKGSLFSQDGSASSASEAALSPQSSYKSIQTESTEVNLPASPSSSAVSFSPQSPSVIGVFQNVSPSSINVQPPSPSLSAVAQYSLNRSQLSPLRRQKKHTQASDIVVSESPSPLKRDRSPSFDGSQTNRKLPKSSPNIDHQSAHCYRGDNKTNPINISSDEEQTTGQQIKSPHTTTTQNINKDEPALQTTRCKMGEVLSSSESSSDENMEQSKCV